MTSEDSAVPSARGTLLGRANPIRESAKDSSKLEVPGTAKGSEVSLEHSLETERIELATPGRPQEDGFVQLTDKPQEATAGAGPKDSLQHTHKQAPKYFDFEALSRLACGGFEPLLPTTWMVRNVPNCYTQGDLVAELDEMGLGDTYDFLYMPMDKASKASIGYAFVNFLDPVWSFRFSELIAGHMFAKHRKNKEASASVAHMQGFLPNVAYYQQCAFRSSKVAKHRPLVVFGAELLPLPR